MQQELAARAEDADRLRRQQVERARYDADVAQRRFLRVDPDNRLVADALEAAWNDRLRALAAAQERYEQTREADARVVSAAQRAEILALATDFPRLWRDPGTSAREKKRMMRLLIADVTLTKSDTMHADIRCTGGATRSLDIPLPKTCVELRTTDTAIVREIDELLDTYTDAEIADLLNERGVRTGSSARAPIQSGQRAPKRCRPPGLLQSRSTCENGGGPSTKKVGLISEADTTRPRKGSAAVRPGGPSRLDGSRPSEGKYGACARGDYAATAGSEGWRPRRRKQTVGCGLRRASPHGRPASCGGSAPTTHCKPRRLFTKPTFT